jgi:hypothetical protein
LLPPFDIHKSSGSQIAILSGMDYLQAVNKKPLKDKLLLQGFRCVIFKSLSPHWPPPSSTALTRHRNEGDS